MKTTSKKSSTKRLNALTVKSETNRFPLAKNSSAYKLAMEVINGAKTIRPVWTSGSGRFTSCQDHTISVKGVLSELGIEYTILNDAPRGGATGTRIDIITKIKPV